LAELGTIPGWRVLGLWVIALALEFVIIRAVTEPGRPMVLFIGHEAIDSSARSTAAADSDNVLSYAVLVRHIPRPQLAGHAARADSLAWALMNLRAANRESLWAANRLPPKLDAAQHDSLLAAIGTMLAPLAKAAGEAAKRFAWFLIEVLAVPATLAAYTVAWFVTRRRRRELPSVAAA
jgi:hypothetical protein